MDGECNVPERMEASQPTEKASSTRRIRFEDDALSKSTDDDNTNTNSDKGSKSSLLLATPAKQAPTALQQKMLAMAGQDIDQFMKEMEEVHKKQEANRAADLQQRLAALGDGQEDGAKEAAPRRGSEAPRESSEGMKAPPVGVPPPVPMGAPAPTSNVPPGPPPLMSLHMMLRPPPHLGAPPMPGARLPAGPPPGRPSLPPGPPPGLPPRMGMRLPPGPPPGLPPRMMRMPMPNMGMVPPLNSIGVPNAGPPGGPNATPNVLSAAPQLINRSGGDGGEKAGATIEGKPQIR